MPENQSALPLLDIHADDDEIARYADLLDGLNVGLWVFAPLSPDLLRSNRTAGLLSDGASPELRDASGLALNDDDLPQHIAARTGRPVFERVFTVLDAERQSAWLSINALPVFSPDEQLRRIALTLTDISPSRQTQIEHERLVTRDRLTGVYNQQHIMYLLENEIHRARRYGTPFSLAQIDVDQFEELCAELGHAQGEVVLAELGRLFVDSLREIDLVGRIGHDDFLFVLPNVALKDALIGLERVRLRIENHAFGDKKLKLTFSGGITEYTGEHPRALLERIRSLLGHARATGRNRFCLDTDML